MEGFALLVAVVCYGLAGYLWWRLRTPVYLFTLVSGHVGALASPLWAILYNIVYRPDLESLATLFGRPLLRNQFIASSWYYTLPAMIVLFLYQSRWWFPGYFSGLLTYIVLLLYHLILETLGLRTNIWTYTTSTLPFSVSNALISAMMAALVSLGLLYVLLLTYRYAPISLLLTLLPATLVLSLLVHGLIGAPLWLALLLPMARDQFWVVSIGLVSTLALLAWAIHIVTNGLRQVDKGVAA